MTRRESSAAKARQTIRQRLLARLPSTTAALPRAYRGQVLTDLWIDGKVAFDQHTQQWIRASTDGPTTINTNPLTRDANRTLCSGCDQEICQCSRVSRAASPSIVDYHADGSIVVIQDNQDTLIFQQHRGDPLWVVRTLTTQIRGGAWTYVDSPDGQALTRVSVNEVAREDRTLDVTITIRVTTRHPNLGQVASLVLESIAADGRPMEFIDGDINALGTGFKINDWSEVPRG